MYFTFSKSAAISKVMLSCSPLHAFSSSIALRDYSSHKFSQIRNEIETHIHLSVLETECSKKLLFYTKLWNVGAFLHQFD